MALSSIKLRYRRGTTTYTVNLYTTAAEVGANPLVVRYGTTTLYAATAGTGSVSFLRFRKGTTTYSIKNCNTCEVGCEVSCQSCDTCVGGECEIR